MHPQTDDTHGRALSILQQLIRIRTQYDEADAVKYILSILSGENISHRVVSHGGNRASLITRIRGCGQRPPVMFMGHLDTIGTESVARWKHHPYGADFDGVCVYGRGASNKGGVTAMMLAAMNLAAMDSLPCDAVFAFNADNDSGGMGARALVEGGFLEDVGEAVFVQPTDCAIGIAQKGVAWLDATVRGKNSHAAFPKQRTDVIKLILEYHKKLASMLCRCEKHPYLGSASCVITELESRSWARYMLPEEARCRIDVRFLPSLSERQMRAATESTTDAMLKRYGECAFEITVENLRLPCAMDESAPYIRKIENICRKLKLKQKKTGIFYLCDVSLVAPRLGVPFAIIGPGEDIYRSNSDEKTRLADVIKTGRLYESLVL